MSTPASPGPQKVEILSADGKPINSSNPLPVDATFSGSITVGAVDQGKAGSSGQSWYIQDGSNLLATAAKQDTGNTSLAAINLAQTDGSQRIGGTVAVTGPLTDTQLRASAVPISAATLPLPTGAAKDSTLTDGTQRIGGTVAISAASLPLPSNAAQETGGNLASILGQLDSKTSTLAAKTQLPTSIGQTTKIGSLSVAIASDQTVPVSGAVSPANTVSAANSSTTPLGGGATFTGVGTDILNYAAVTIFAYSDVAGTLYLEYSTNNTNWDLSIPYSLTATNPLDVPSGPHAQYFRVRYVNGGVAQSTFRLQTLLLASIPAPHTIPLSSSPAAGDDAVLVQAEIVGVTTAGGGAYVPVKVNPSGAVQVGGGVAVYDSTNTNPAQVVNTVPTSGYGLAVRNIYPAQASTTSGQTGPLVQGAVTTAAPSYTTAQTSPLSLTTAGALRTDSSATTQPVSGTVAVSNAFALDATLAKLTVAQGTALGTNTQALVGGSVTTAAPTYTTGQISPFSLTTGGALRVDASGTTQPISGTVTANIGTSGSLALDASVTGLQVSQGSTTSGQKGGLTLGAVTTAAPTYTTAQTSPLSLTTTGLLRVTDPGLPTLGTAGTAASTVLTVQGIASMTPVQVSQATASSLNATVVQATASSLNAQVFGGAPNGSLVSGNPVLVAGSDGTSARSLRTDTSGNQIISGAGTAGSPSGGVVTVQGTTSMTALVVGGAANSGSGISGAPVPVGGTDGTNVRYIATDTSGRQKNAGYASFSYITSATTTAVKTSAGILRSVSIVATASAGSCTVYDANNATTNPIAGFTLTSPITHIFNLVVNNGITVVTGAGFNGQVTVVYD